MLQGADNTIDLSSDDRHHLNISVSDAEWREMQEGFRKILEPFEYNISLPFRDAVDFLCRDVVSGYFIYFTCALCYKLIQ